MRSICPLLIAFLLPLAACKSEKELDRLFLPNTKTDRPRVLTTNPSDGIAGFQSTEAVWVLFDQPMDQQKTEDAFHLSSDRAAVEGAFDWEFNRLTFRSRAPLITGQAYTMIIGQASESTAGVDLGADTTIHFHAGNDVDAPRFVSSVPAANTISVDPASSVRLSFSEGMSYASIAGGISISPSFAFTISMQNGSRDIVFVPSNPLVNGTYRVTYNGALTDLAGLPLANEGSFLFTVGSDFIPPALLSAKSGSLSLSENILTTGAKKMDAIVLQFSEAMNRTSVEDALALSPSQPSTRKWETNATGDQLTITFTPSLVPETGYTLSLSSSATDLAGNPLGRNYSFPFLTNGPSSTRPHIIEVRQLPSSAPVPDSKTDCADGASVGSSSGTPLVSMQPFDPYQLIDVNGTDGALACVLQFQFSFNNEMIRTSLVHATDPPGYIITPDSGAASNPLIYNLQMNPGNRRMMVLSIQGSFPKTIPGAEATPILLFRIRGGSGGATDIDGNEMAEDYLLYLTY